MTANKPNKLYSICIVIPRGSGMLEKEEVVAEKVRFEETLEGPKEVTVWKSGESVPGRKQPVQRKAQRWEQQ